MAEYRNSALQAFAFWWLAGLIVVGNVAGMVYAAVHGYARPIVIALVSLAFLAVALRKRFRRSSRQRGAE